MRRTAMASLAASVCLFSVTACSANEPTEASPPAESGSPTSASPNPSTSPTDTVPAYLKKYSEEERTAYREAADDYAAFSRRLAAINEAGRATPKAKAFFRQQTAAWQTYWARLRTNERRGIQIVGTVEALPHVKDYLASHTDSVIRIVVADDPGETLVVPRGAVELLARVLAHMAAGQGVSVVPAHAELTTQQAAELLNVSRPFLIGLLDAGDIEYRKVGKHRRIKAQSLMAYMARDDQERRGAADELTRLNQEMGLL